MNQSVSKVDSFTLKVVAIIGMTANHFGNVFGTYLPLSARAILIGLGGLTFPIMAYQLTVGYQHTRDVKKYAFRLGVFALISLLPFIWVLGNSLNVLFTLLLGLIIIWADDILQGSDAKRFVFYMILAGAIALTYWCDWGIIGVPMILLYHRGMDKNWQAVLPIVLVWLWGLSALAELIVGGVFALYWKYYLPTFLYCFVGATFTIPLLKSYNGQQGRSMKYFFYVYYPLHIVLLGLAKGLIFGAW